MGKQNDDYMNKYSKEAKEIYGNLELLKRIDVDLMINLDRSELNKKISLDELERATGWRPDK